MLLHVNLKAYYEWEPMEGKPTQKQIDALEVKPALDGTWLKRVTLQKETHTQVGIPEQQITELDAHFKGRKSRARIAAWVLEEHVMPHHAHPEDWVSIEVHDEPEVQAQLNRYFDLEGA